MKLSGAEAKDRRNLFSSGVEGAKHLEGTDLRVFSTGVDVPADFFPGTGEGVPEGVNGGDGGVSENIDEFCV